MAFLTQQVGSLERGASCSYQIDCKTSGDPKVGCAKDYVAEWTCAGSPRKRQAVVAPEAGFKKQVVLSGD